MWVQRQTPNRWCSCQCDLFCLDWFEVSHSQRTLSWTGRTWKISVVSTSYAMVSLTWQPTSNNWKICVTCLRLVKVFALFSPTSTLSCNLQLFSQNSSPGLNDPHKKPVAPSVKGGCERLSYLDLTVGRNGGKILFTKAGVTKEWSYCVVSSPTFHMFGVKTNKSRLLLQLNTYCIFYLS